MLKYVGMTMPQSRETCAVRQGMMAFNNSNICNPIIRDVGRGYVHVYVNVIIVACPHPLSCCIHTTLIPSCCIHMPSSPVLLHVYCTCFSSLWHCHPYILQHFNGNVFTPLFHWFFVVYSLANTMLLAFV